MAINIRNTTTIPCFQYCYSQVLRPFVSDVSQSGCPIVITANHCRGVCRGRETGKSGYKRMNTPPFCPVLFSLCFSGIEWTFTSFKIDSHDNDEVQEMKTNRWNPSNASWEIWILKLWLLFHPELCLLMLALLYTAFNLWLTLFWQFSIT